MRSAAEQLEPNPPDLRRVESLVSPFGLVSRSAALPAGDGDPAFAVHVSSVGDPSKVLGNLRDWDHHVDMGNVNGVGSALSGGRARLISIAEAVERYSTCAWDDADIVVAAERELDEECVSPARWPQCSARELASDDCGLVAYHPGEPIRWVRAWSLTRRCTVLVPAVAVYLHMVPQSRSELFTRGVTTGAAVHSDPRSAVLNGLLEVVERDALSLAWLQRLRLPRIDVSADDLDPLDRACHHTGTAGRLQVRFFDATTDFGIPVVYAVQLADHDPALCQVVCATCDLDPRRAIGKIHRELAAVRIALRDYVAKNPVRRPADGAVSVVGGAAYNAAMDRRAAFAHLLDGPRAVRAIDELPNLSTAADPLHSTVNLLRDRGAEVLAVDITTDEARQAGLHAVKVLVPEAVPLSFVHSERYLGTPRLYRAPEAMGFPCHAEESLNPEPQPLA